MNKALYFCFIGFMFFSNSCFAQNQPTTHDTVRVVEIINGRSLREKSIDSVNKLETIAGNVLIREGFTKFSCDSAIIDRKQNTIEAFGNVHINDADSLHTYSDYLIYFGNERMAHLKKNVKLTDKKGILFTDNLDYDLAAGIGNYHEGGKVINGTTVLTSKDGVYYADTKDVYFRNNVDLTDPKRKIKADSLLYNTLSQLVTFIGPTEIKSPEATIFTSQGTYDLKNGNAFFGTRSLITDSSSRIYQADRIALDEKAGLAELEGSAVIKDSANGVIVTANHIYLNNRNNSFLATNKPVMIIQQDKDSIYIAADTLFSGFTTKISAPAKNDSARLDSLPTTSLSKDSLPVSEGKRMGREFGNKNDTSSKAVLLPVQADSARSVAFEDSAFAPKVQRTEPQELHEKDSSSRHPPDRPKKDSVNTTALKNDSLAVQEVKRSKREIKNKKASLSGDTTVQERRDSVKATFLPPDSLQVTVLQGDKHVKSGIPDTSAPQVQRADSIAKLRLSNDSSGVDTVKQTTILDVNQTDTSVRYFLAFHHVRIFNDSLQSVCDSMFFSAKDSVFRLFYEPVVWNGQSQVTGDTIYLYTKNKKPERLYVFENGMIVNKNQKNLYNQVSGKTINAYFKNGVIDYARVKGQKAESIYYVQDKDSAYVGMNRANGDVIDLYFKEGDLNKVKFINDVHGTMYPIRQVPEDEKFLKDFNWQEKRRPKNKLELFE